MLDDDLISLNTGHWIEIRDLYLPSRNYRSSIGQEVEKHFRFTIDKKTSIYLVEKLTVISRLEEDALSNSGFLERSRENFYEELDKYVSEGLKLWEQRRQELEKELDLLKIFYGNNFL